MRISGGKGNYGRLFRTSVNDECDKLNEMMTPAKQNTTCLAHGRKYQWAMVCQYYCYNGLVADTK